MRFSTVRFVHSIRLDGRERDYVTDTEHNIEMGDDGLVRVTHRSGKLPTVVTHVSNLRDAQVEEPREVVTGTRDAKGRFGARAASSR